MPLTMSSPTPNWLSPRIVTGRLSVGQCVSQTASDSEDSHWQQLWLAWWLCYLGFLPSMACLSFAACQPEVANQHWPAKIANYFSVREDWQRMSLTDLRLFVSMIIRFCFVLYWDIPQVIGKRQSHPVGESWLLCCIWSMDFGEDQRKTLMGKEMFPCYSFNLWLVLIGFGSERLLHLNTLGNEKPNNPNPSSFAWLTTHLKAQALLPLERTVKLGKKPQIGNFMQADR